MLKLYKRLTRKCRTVNQHNQVHIALENWMTPLQLTRLHSELEAERAEPHPVRLWAEKKMALVFKKHYFHWQKSQNTERWIAYIMSLMRRNGKAEAEPFLRHCLGPHSTLYRDALRPSTQKTLLICFTGGGHRMMMSLGTFLQQFDARKVDVVWIRCPKTVGYRYGLENVGSDLKETLENLHAILPPERYKRTVTMGASAGAVPAVLAALLHDFPAAMGVGITSPTEKRWYEALGMRIDTFARTVTDIDTKKTKITLFCGQDDPRDLQASLDWEYFTDHMTIRRIYDQQEPVKHNALLPFLKRGELVELFHDTLIKTS